MRTLFLASSSAPSSTSARMQSTLPCRAAFASGVDPLCQASHATQRSVKIVHTAQLLAAFLRSVAHPVFALKLCAFPDRFAQRQHVAASGSALQRVVLRLAHGALVVAVGGTARLACT